MNHSMGPALQPDDHSRRTQAIEEYVGTDTFVADSVQWVADARELPADLVDHIAVAYVDSSQFDTVIDDCLDGEKRWP